MVPEIAKMEAEKRRWWEKRNEKRRIKKQARKNQSEETGV